jgi:hypothetical protein
VAGTAPPPPPPPQASKPATHTNVFAFVCVSHIYIYIYIYAPHHTDIDRSISVYSLSLYIVLVLVACTLSHHHHHHTTRAVRVYVRVCVCIWLPFEQCFRRPDNRPHNDIIDMPRTNNRRTPRHSNAPRHALLGAGHGVLCVCIGVSCCEAAVRGGRVEIRAVPPPPPACCHKGSRQAGMQETGTHLPTMLLLL